MATRARSRSASVMRCTEERSHLSQCGRARLINPVPFPAIGVMRVADLHGNRCPLDCSQRRAELDDLILAIAAVPAVQRRADPAASARIQHRVGDESRFPSGPRPLPQVVRTYAEQAPHAKRSLPQWDARRRRTEAHFTLTYQSGRQPTRAGDIGPHTGRIADERPGNPRCAATAATRRHHGPDGTRHTTLAPPVPKKPGHGAQPSRASNCPGTGATAAGCLATRVESIRGEACAATIDSYESCTQSVGSPPAGLIRARPAPSPASGGFLR